MKHRTEVRIDDITACPHQLPWAKTAKTTNTANTASTVQDNTG